MTRTPKASRLAALFLALGFALALFAGCSPAKKVLVGNLEPETVITVRSVAPDTLRAANHLVRLSWFGSDPDGDVVAYELRLVNTLTPADSQWVRLDCGDLPCTDSLFTLYTPDGFTRAELQVRAVDDKGARDSSPAKQNFSFLNPAPLCTITSGPGPLDSSYASVTIAWNVDDRGGDLSRLSFRVFLDGNEANYDSVYTGTSTAEFTVPSARFIQGPGIGQWRSGPRTVSVRAVDDGGRLGPISSLSWYVRSPGLVPLRADSVGKILLVDNSHRNAPNDFTVDTMYTRTIAREGLAGRFSVLHLDVNNPFRSAADLAQTFRQFEAVVWYRGFDIFAATTLTAFQDSVYAYLRNGGRFYIEGLNLLEGPGQVTVISPPMFREQFMSEFLNSAWQRKFYNVTTGDSSIAWGTRNRTDPNPPIFRSSVLGDSMLMATAVLPGMRVFVPNDTSQVALWAKPNALEPIVPENLAIAMTVRQPSQGRAVAVTFPVRQTFPTATNPRYAQPWVMLQKLLFHPTHGLMAP